MALTTVNSRTGACTSDTVAIVAGLLLDRIGGRLRRDGSESIMAEMDWNAPAEVQCRDDGGSDMYYNFKTMQTGTFAAMIRWVLNLPSEDRARVIVDARGIGSHNIHDVTTLSQRADFPTE